MVINLTTWLITGGAGSLGRELVKILSQNKDDTIRILDNHEYSLSKLDKKPNIRLLHGDIADKDRVKKAVHDVDIVIHTAAMKNLDITEYNTFELIKTNIIGTENVMSCSAEANVKKVMFISSDKAVEPISVYGSSKLTGEYITLNYNNIEKNTKYSIFRSGNFIDSNGNVKEIWKKQAESGEPITITDFKCLRYFILTEVAALTILKAIDIMKGGEVFIPDESIMQEKSITSLMTECGINRETLSLASIIGLRRGEKIREQLMTQSEVIRKRHNEDISCWVINHD